MIAKRTMQPRHQRLLQEIHSALISGTLPFVPVNTVRNAQWSAAKRATTRIGLLFVAVTLIWSGLLLTVQPASAQTFQLFVPSIGTDGPSGTGEEPIQCELSAEEQALANLMAADPAQKRTNPICHAILAEVARARAQDMATRRYFSHTNPDGDGPNLLVREAGYPLPDWYGDAQNSNNVESIGGGYESAAAAWNAWLNSPSHRTHVLGTQGFYAEQRAYGVGYYVDPNSPYTHYWVFISAPVE